MTETSTERGNGATTKSERDWFVGKWGDIAQFNWRLSKVIIDKDTSFQHVLIAKNPYLGTFLCLDGKVQSSELDERIYHECLIHPALVCAGNPKRVLLIGNGEGCGVREILRWPNITQIDWIDIDKELVEYCQKFLPYSWKGSDSRVHQYFSNALDFIETAQNDYDAVILDLTEYDGKKPLANTLFESTTYEKISKLLTPNGAMVTFCADLSTKPPTFPNLPKTVTSIFPHASVMHFFVPSFGTAYRLVVASKSRDPRKIPQSEIAKTIKPFASELWYYDEKIHAALFTIAKHSRIDMRTTF